MDHLLTVTFSAPERQKVQNAPMDTFEGAIRRAFPARRHRHTVSNPRFATDRDPHIAQVLARLDAQDDVLIQPCLVSPGTEWEKLRTLLSGCSHPFRRLALGRPLLASREDALDCARAILPELPDTPVVIGGVIYIAAAISISNLIVDLIYTFIDPRLKTRLRNY